ncbi:MAG: ATP-binding protein [Mariprofundaceae bacterium]|nr:ATP-binding protein [Mariprofundaceae bacterium]
MNERLHNMLEHIPGCVWSASSELKYRDTSARAEKVFGLSGKQLLGRTLWSWLPDEKQRQANTQQLRAAIEQHKPDLELAYCIDIKGQERWFGENIYLHFSSEKNGGEPLLQGLYGISNDITQRKTSETANLKMQQQAHKMEAIGTLVGGIAHEFNNILAGIVGNVFLLKMDTEAGTKSAERLDRVEKLSHRAAGLVDQMLAFGRRQYTAVRDVQLKPLLDQICAIELADMPAYIRLNHHIRQGIVLRADPTQMKQVLVSLINNAVDACRDQNAGEIRIDLDEQQDEAAFFARFPHLNPTDMLCLRISDNGSGIAKAVLDRVFDPFFTTKEVGHGTGMGLSMAYGLIESFGGAIYLESKEGIGTTVHLYLLRSKSDEVREEQPAEEIYELQYGHGEVVLLADDEPLLREAGKDTLEKIGYQPVLVENGLAALEYIRDNPATVSIALLDLIMPVMSGKEAAVEIRKICPELPIIFVTGYNFDSKQDRGIDMSRSQVISKPYNVRHLSKIIDTLLQAAADKE